MSTSRRAKVPGNMQAMGFQLPLGLTHIIYVEIHEYQHLQRGAKCLLRGVNSPSLRVQLATPLKVLVFMYIPIFYKYTSSYLSLLSTFKSLSYGNNKHVCPAQKSMLNPPKPGQSPNLPFEASSPKKKPMLVLIRNIQLHTILTQCWKDARQGGPNKYGLIDIYIYECNWCDNPHKWR